MRRLEGAPLAQALSKRLAAQIAQLRGEEIILKLAIIRVGSRADDLSYERAILKRFAALHAVAEVAALPEDVPQELLERTVLRLNDDPTVHGILLFRPLPGHLSEAGIKAVIAQEKDIDGMGVANAAHIFLGDGKGYPPCTSEAVMELMDFYGIDAAGKKAVVVGRSLVVGKPLAMLLLARNATVTVCHTKTAALAEACRNADLLFACAGVAGLITADFTHPHQIVIDAGVNVKDGRLCGDVDYDAVAGHVEAITPVPGGVGAVTNLILLKHTVRSAANACSGTRP